MNSHTLKSAACTVVLLRLDPHRYYVSRAEYTRNRIAYFACYRDKCRLNHNVMDRPLLCTSKSKIKGGGEEETQDN